MAETCEKESRDEVPWVRVLSLMLRYSARFWVCLKWMKLLVSSGLSASLVETLLASARPCSSGPRCAAEARLRMLEWVRIFGLAFSWLALLSCTADS